MRIHLANSLILPGSVVAIGTFDGVHIGHQKVIGEMVEQSRRLGVPAVVYTFDPPPRYFFNNTLFITTIQEKLNRLAALGVDDTVVATFDYKYIRRSARSFIKELSMLNPLEIFVGNDFRFGREREGGIKELSEHFRVKVVELVRCPRGEVISSSRIRQLIARGQISEAHALLGDVEGFPHWNEPVLKSKLRI